MAPRVLSTPEVVRSAVESYARRLRAHFGPAVVEIRLFGSHARGEGGEDSDVDVAVILDSVDWARRRAVIDLATDVGLDLDLRLSPTLLDRTTFERWIDQERALTRDILEEGVLL